MQSTKARQVPNPIELYRGKNPFARPRFGQMLKTDNTTRHHTLGTPAMKTLDTEDPDLGCIERSFLDCAEGCVSG